MNSAADNLLKFIDNFSARGIGILRDDSMSPYRAIVFGGACNVSPSLVNEVITLTGGLIFVAVSNARAKALMLSPMAKPITSPVQLPTGHDALMAICTSVEAREGVTTGISTSDRARTISIIGDPHPNPRLLVKPGHIFPVEVRDGGVLVKNVLPEGAFDIVKIAGMTDSAFFVDLLNSKGEYLSTNEQDVLASKSKIPLVSLSELVRYRLETEKLITKVAEAKLPTRIAGDLRACIYKSVIHEGEHLALVKGDISGDEPVLTRVQPEFTFGDVFGGFDAPSRASLHNALSAIARQGRGVVVYLRSQEAGKLGEQVKNLLSQGTQRSGALMREYGIGAQILRDLGVKRIDLLTGSKKQLSGLKTFGIEIVRQTEMPNDGCDHLR